MICRTKIKPIMFIIAICCIISYTFTEFFPEPNIVKIRNSSGICRGKYNGEGAYLVDVMFSMSSLPTIKSFSGDWEMIVMDCSFQTYITDAYPILTYKDKPTSSEYGTIIFWVNDPLPKNGSIEKLMKDGACFRITGRRFLDQRDYIASQLVKFPS